MLTHQVLIWNLGSEADESVKGFQNTYDAQVILADVRHFAVGVVGVNIFARLLMSECTVKPIMMSAVLLIGCCLWYKIHICSYFCPEIGRSTAWPGMKLGIFW